MVSRGSLGAVLVTLSGACLMGVPSQVAMASTLSDATASLRSATQSFSKDASKDSVDKSVIDEAISSATKETTKSCEEVKTDLAKLSKSVDEVSSAPDLTTDEMRSLDERLSEADDLGRRGWSYTPPAAGQAKAIDIARAAVDLATSASPGPEYTDPSDPHAAYYVDIHDRFLPGDDYKACSCGTSTAIHWSGADPDFPRNTSSIVHAYCANSPRWRFVGHSPDKEFLEPGDIFTSDYHTYMYVGNEVVRERFPDSDADVYTSGNQLPFLYWDSYNDRGYDVYRFVGE